MLYFILFSILLAFSINELISHKTKIASLFYGMTGTLILFAGVRENTGTDYLSYLKLWNEVEPASLLVAKYFRYAELERGFVLIISSLKQITSSSVLHYLLLAGLAFIPFVSALKKLRIEYLFIALIHRSACHRTPIQFHQPAPFA